MTIAELFVKLGITGGEKAKKDIEGVKGGMADLASMSLEAKAAILAAMYAVEEMGRKSAQTGNDLRQFENVTGMSAVTLQKFIYAARQVGVGANDVTSSIKGIQSAMTAMAYGKGPPEALALFTRYVGGIDKSKLNDAFYLVQKFQEFVQKAPANMTRMLAPSMGITEAMLSAMHQHAFTAQTLNKAPVYSENQISSLQNVQVGWANLGASIEMAFGKLNAKHGPQLIKDISLIAKELFKLADVLLTIGERLKIFEHIHEVFAALGGILGLVNSSVKTDEDGKPIKEQGTDVLADIYHGGKTVGVPAWAWFAKFMESQRAGIAANQPKFDPQTGRVIQVEVNQNIQHTGDAKDTKSVKELHKAAASGAIQSAGRQFRPDGI